MKAEEGQKLADEFVAKMGEHFDVVQVMVSWRDERGHTMCSKRGCGNWYARQGMAHEFINEDVAQETARAISEIERPPDSGDDWKAPA